MKKAIFGIVIITALFIFAGCNNGLQDPPQIPETTPGTGRLTVDLDRPDGRTLLPQVPEFSRYALNFRYTAGGVSDINETADTLPFSIPLLPGEWRVTVTGYVYIEDVDGILDGDYVAASGEADVTIEAGVSTPVTVDLYRTNSTVKGVFEYDIGLPAEGLAGAGLNILSVTDRTVVTTKNLLEAASGGIALDEGYYLVQVRVVTGRVRAKTELMHIYGGHTTIAAGAAWDFDTEEGVYLSLAELSAFLSTVPANTVDNPYSQIKLITDWASLSTPDEFLGNMYSVLNGRYVGIDLSEAVNVDGIGVTTTYSANRNRLVSVVLPEGLTAIGDGAFYGCTGLTNVIIPDSVTSIGSYAFQNCIGLTNITIPDRVTSIENGAFSNCTGLTSVTFNGVISSSGFSSDNIFPGDLRIKYFDTFGGIGLYITADPGNNAVWMREGVAGITAPFWLVGSAVSLAVPTIAIPAGQTVTAQGWQISDNGSSVWANFTPPATADMSWNGKSLRYYIVSSGNQTYYSNIVNIRVFDTNNIVTVTNTDEWNTVLNFISSNGNDQTYIINVNGDVPVTGSTDNTFGTATGMMVTLKGTGKLYLTSQGNMIRLTADQTLIIDSVDLILQGLTNGQNGAAEDNNATVVYVNSNGILKMENGEISGNTTTSTVSSSYGGVCIANATFIMNGGKISGHTSSMYGGGVNILYGGTFTMNSGVISGNTCNYFGGTTSGSGGGVFVGDSGIFTMTGGIISDNTARDGGGVFIYYGGTTIEGGEILGNTALNNGGGVYLYSGTFTMNSGEISGNNAFYGGGVYVANNSIFRIVTGAIYGSNENNSSLRNTSSGGAALNKDNSGTAERGTFNNTTWVSAGSLYSTDTTIWVTNGEFIGISNNTVPVWYEGSAFTLTTPEVTLPERQTITAQGWQISDTGSGGWSNFTPPPTVDISFKGKSLRYYAVSSGGQTYYSNAVIISILDANNMLVSNADEWNAAITIINNGGNDQTYTVHINGDIGVEGATIGTATGTTVILKGTGKLYLTNQGNLIRIGSNRTLIIDSAYLTLQGLTNGQNGATQDNNTAVVYINSNGTFIMEDGEISGNTTITSSSSTSSGGVYVAANATFIMNGGKISGNTNANTTTTSTSFSGGGGVYVAGNGSFTMNGGTISGNTNTSSSASPSYAYGGGGVFIAANAAFTMNSGDIISNTDNTNYNRGGGGVFVNGSSSSSGVFNMSGGTISGNSSQGGAGGGVNVYEYATFTMGGGIISGNTASLQGGGVYKNSYATFTMSGGTISGNTASNYGGGVYATGSGNFTMLGGIISGNTSNRGGGVCVVSYGGIFHIVNGTVYGSNASPATLRNTLRSGGSGAALYVESGTAQRGILNGETWNSMGDLSTTDDTINVVNGVLQ